MSGQEAYNMIKIGLSRMEFDNSQEEDNSKSLTSENHNKINIGDIQNLNNDQKQQLFLELRKDFKKRFKTEEKRHQNIKFIIGKHYYLLTKAPFGNKRIYREFILKKFCYCRNDMPLNILILKEVGEYDTIKYTLNRNDCIKYHVKYEPGLQIFPMSMKWNEKE